MNDKTLVIVDAGHGGIDSGAVGNNLKEKDLTLEAAKYMFNRLEDLGINAVMTRTDDEYLPKRDRINRILSLYNNDPNTLIISNHINAGGSDISNYEGLNLKKIIYHNIFYIFFHCHMDMVHSCQLFFLAILSFFFLILNVRQLFQFLNR